MTNYNLEEFETWINQSEVRKNTSGISGYINNLKTVTNWTQYLEIIRGRSSFTLQEQCLKLFKEWLEGVDEQGNAEHQQQIQAKEQQITQLQTQLNNTQTRNNQLQQQITQLTEQKETYSRSAGYLRETLRNTESELESVKRELAESQEKAQSAEQEKTQILTEKTEELKQRNEGFKVVSERNADLQTKLNASQQEISKLNEWISKLESLSQDGDLVSGLKGELERVQTHNASLQEQLSAKKGRNHWWIYIIIALAGIYFIVK